MPRHYSTKDFFRQMPNALLARYFEGRGTLDTLDFSALSETKTDVLFGLWLNLPEAQRNLMDAEFRDIFELSCEKGFRAILDEALFHLSQDADPLAYSAFVDKLAAHANHFERAMVTFLDHQPFWKGATRFHHADSLPYWRKRKHLGHQAAAVDPASIHELANRIRGYFHHTEGRGNNCVVEPFRRGELDYFFAYPEDYSQQSIEWVDGAFDCRPHNPAFEVIFVYSHADGSLDLNFRGSYKAIEPLQNMFCSAIFKAFDGGNSTPACCSRIARNSASAPTKLSPNSLAMASERSKPLPNSLLAYCPALVAPVLLETLATFCRPASSATLAF